MLLRKTSAILFLVCALLSGCGRSGAGEIGFTPLFTPLRISIDTNGRLSFSVSRELIPTPIGNFDIGVNYGFDLDSVEEKYANEKVLIVRINKEAKVYKLDENESFRVEFWGGDTLYKQVNLEYRANGTVILELETVPAGSVADAPVDATVIPALPTRVPIEPSPTLVEPTNTNFSDPQQMPATSQSSSLTIHGIRVGVADKKRVRIVVDVESNINEAEAYRIFGISSQQSPNDKVDISIRGDGLPVPDVLYLNDADQMADVLANRVQGGLGVSIDPKIPLYLYDKFFLPRDQSSSYNRFVVDLCLDTNCSPLRR